MSGQSKVKVYRRATLNRKQRWGWTLYASNGRKIANSGEGYESFSTAKSMARRVVDGEWAGSAVVR